MTTSHATARDQLAAVLAASRRLPPDVVVEVSLAYDLLCDPIDPPPPPLPAAADEATETLSLVRRQLVLAITAAAGVDDAVAFGTAARHLARALDMLGHQTTAR